MGTTTVSKVTDTWPHPLAKAAAEGCCGTPEHRGYLCQYHDGYASAVEDTLALVETVLLDTLQTLKDGGK